MTFHFEFSKEEILVSGRKVGITFMKAAFVYSCEKLNYIITNITFLKSC